MNILVIGGNGSGKSAYAEKLVKQLSSQALYSGSSPMGEKLLYYIATMIPYGDEGAARVAKHRKQRASLGFTTCEKAINVSDLPIPSEAAVLLEDVSNLLGNAIFSYGGDGESVLADIRRLCEKCKNCVMVTIGGLEPKPAYDRDTNGYIDALNRLNGRLSDYADMVVEMRGGCPFVVKGDAHALD